MKVENGKIIEANESELYCMYIERELEEFMDFREFKRRMITIGCAIKDNESSQNKTL